MAHNLVTDYASEDYRKLSGYRSKTYEEVKELLDDRSKDLIIKMLENKRDQKQMGKRTTAKSRGQDIRHATNVIFNEVSRSKLLSFPVLRTL